MTHRPDVLAEVIEMLGEVIGHDLLTTLRVGPDTTFSGDLAMESIEFVALADRVRRRYGDRVDLPAFFAEMDLDRLTALTVGDLAGYVQERLAALHA
jgi:acyl carrier protein